MEQAHPGRLVPALFHHHQLRSPLLAALPPVRSQAHRAVPLLSQEVFSRLFPRALLPLLLPPPPPRQVVSHLALMEAAVATSAAPGHLLVLAVPNTATVARPRLTAGQAANQLLEHVEAAASPTLQVRHLSRSARTKHAVPEPQIPVRDQVTAIAVHGMVIVEAPMTTVERVVRQALDLADSLLVQFSQTRRQVVR